MEMQTSSNFESTNTLSSISGKISSLESSYVFLSKLDIPETFNFEEYSSINSIAANSLLISEARLNTLTSSSFHSKSHDELITYNRMELNYNTYFVNYNSVDFEHYFKILLLISQDDVFSIGEISKTEKIYAEMSERFSSKTLFRYFSLIISKNYGNTQLLISVANYLSTYSYEEASEYGVDILLTSLLPHKNSNVVEFVLRIFDNWHNKDSLKILDNVSMNTDWLELYLNKIKASILRAT